MYMKTKIISILVLLAAISQVVTAGTISIDAFTGDTYSGLFTLIQPAGYVFSIWGVIYLLSFLYAVYQVIPANDNEYLQHNRPYALSAFIASGVWLFAAGQSLSYVWTTVPILVFMAYVLYQAVVFKPGHESNLQTRFFSHYALFPYAAWTAIAQFVNVHSIVNQYSLIESVTGNLILGVILLVLLAVLVLFTLRRVEYSPWYGLVIVWATVGVVVSNTQNPAGEVTIQLLAGLLGLVSLILVLKHCRLAKQVENL